MVNITLSVPEDIKKEMEKFPEINWSVIAREAIKRRIFLLRKFREFTKDSELTEEDTIRLGSELNKSLRKRHEK
ncbi:hypothetical protein COU62_02220 [Candidatus Pacearchaeota archaeon CG10_big_fil_rev_8_21_14_0_10_35_219]|nr:hypothetical protein [Candidatus Pacearchaeota archaeon]OIO41961.1 MAG: hypothetical protein AUJ63_04370 [Candidatus Pacearchaeota archaeon CG1_02_35_32]PIO07785.1 MAG: hypothetical protein COU62_02220 [Candidatus Pacearchaeota archaeon CG10_big_fil_rev_8_21_14_0_10_35_219]PIY81007.1 MAG: hypothetical protein COY79_04330 [Candidatus Pacearchaeota archaeon CG_4_10_14_0_8_um_filter_35_169]PIZ79876.1 MAG: hypothetical protein COY00_02635 [Candidatus Pacearchaeota archaeon CG_4_10_14_0_2_um_filt